MGIYGMRRGPGAEMRERLLQLVALLVAVLIPLGVVVKPRSGQDLEQPNLVQCFNAGDLVKGEDNPANPATKIGTGPRLKVIAFDPDVGKVMTKIILAPPGIDPTGSVEFHLWWDIVTDTDEVVWNLNHLPLADGEDWTAIKSTVALGTITVPATGSLMDHVTVSATVSSLGWVANDMVMLRIHRNAGIAADDAAGDAHLIQLCVEIPVVR